MRMNPEEQEEGGGDRLSGLPDELIHKILSFLSLKEAIRVAVLSSRWRFIWTSLPYLNFATNDLPTTLPSKYVTSVLFLRNNITEVYSMKLNIRVKESLLSLKRIFKYAFSHNIQQLDVSFVLDKVYQFPLSLFSSQSLRSLTFTMQISNQYRLERCLTSTWELPALTTLNLHCVTLSCEDQTNKPFDIFSKCANLKNLTLKEFNIKGSNRFSIVHPRLSNLTLENDSRMVSVVNVVAPQLHNLTIRFCFGKYVITAPGLASLLYKGFYPLHLSTEGFHSLKKADICVTKAENKHANQIVCLLQQIHNVHFLTLNSEIVELLSSSSVDLMLQQPSPFVNLTSLKIYPEIVYGSVHKKVNVMSTNVKSYLLGGSPDCTLTMVFREEIQAQKLMAELRVCLKKEKAKSKTYWAHPESHRPKKLCIEENMTKIKSGWEDLVVQLQRRKENASLIISKFRSIEELVRKLPASNKAKIQPCFSSLCAEVDIAISMITGGMMI